jgi:hypothetical protein
MLDKAKEYIQSVPGYLDALTTSIINTINNVSSLDCHYTSDKVQAETNIEGLLMSSQESKQAEGLKFLMGVG